MVKTPTTIASSALAAAKTDSVAFRRSFRADPVAALKAKGLSISPTEARRLATKVRELSSRPGAGSDAAAVEVSVTVKVSF